MADILGIGELLWDVFPQGRTLGGAPANFVYHCCQLGHDVAMVSRIGTDRLGQDILRDLASRNISDQYVQRDASHATGTVRITMSGTSHTLANVLKLNDEEIFVLAGLLEIAPEGVEAICHELISKFDLKLISVTRGDKGAIMVSANESAEHDGEQVEVVDTVGV